jgi:hypothetical protein
MRSPLLPLAAFTTAVLAVAALAGCGHQPPSESKVGDVYRYKVDDAVRESASIILVTTREAIIANDCAQVDAARDPAALDKLIADGLAARLNANVTIYTPPFTDPLKSATPFVVTDDNHAGMLCTRQAFIVVKSS